MPHRNMILIAVALAGVLGLTLALFGTSAGCATWSELLGQHTFHCFIGR